MGFSVETTDMLKNSIQKLKKKNLDLVVVNNPGEEGAGFEVDTNIVTVISASGETIKYPMLTKEMLADILVRKAASLL